MDEGQLLGCSVASGREWVVLGCTMPEVGLLGACTSLGLVHGDTEPRLWRLEEELAGLSKDLKDDWWPELLEWTRDWLLQREEGPVLGTPVGALVAGTKGSGWNQAHPMPKDGETSPDCRVFGHLARPVGRSL